MMTIELTAPGARALVEPSFGGRLHQLFVTIDGAERALLLVPEDIAAYEAAPTSGGCFPMAPWPNRIRDGAFSWAGQAVRVQNGRPNALHGLVLDRPWEVVARVGRVVELACDFGDRWPWPGRAWQRIELGAGFLAMKMEVRASREAFPAGCGWHPWFRRDFAGSATVSMDANATGRYPMLDQLPTGRFVPLDGSYLLDGQPAGDRRLDDCYTAFDGPPAVTITWERLSLAITFGCETPHLQVYTPPEAVCLEPQTCAPDAFNLARAEVSGGGMAIAAPGRPVSLAMRWAWTLR